MGGENTVTSLPFHQGVEWGGSNSETQQDWKFVD